MKKLILILTVIVAGLPMVALANHLRGTWGEFGSNYISFSVGDHHRRFSHSGNIPFVDDHGATVDYHTLRRNHPITVDYSGRNGHETVNRVIVHQRRHGH